MDFHTLGALFPIPDFERVTMLRCLSQNKQNGHKWAQSGHSGGGWFLQFPQESFMILNLAEGMRVNRIRAMVKEGHIDKKRNFCVFHDRLGCVSLTCMWVILVKPCTMPATEVSSKD